MASSCKSLQCHRLKPRGQRSTLLSVTRKFVLGSYLELSWIWICKGKNPNSTPHLLNCRIMTFALPTPRNPVGEENLCSSKISRRLMNPNESLLCTFSLSRFPKVKPDYEWIVFLFLCNVVINYVQPCQGLRRLYLIMNYLYSRVSMSFQPDIIMCWTWTSKDN